jgi:phytoene dehydrogenase-like protein
LAKPTQSHYHTVIIGAGMSGLAGGIRLAHYGYKVLILDQHGAPGGLNSFYSIAGRKYDVGLHALTNYSAEGVKGTPLMRLLRQLRISRDEWQLSQQCGSRIAFTDADLCFTNDPNVLESEVDRAFPSEIDGFRRLVSFVRGFDAFDLHSKETSARQFIKDYLKDPLLCEMLFCPLMYYGSARENDMDLSQFVIMFRALFLEGLARPLEGVRVILRSLTDRYRALGGERKMNCEVVSLIPEGDRIREIHLRDGSVITADHILSSAGRPETMAMVRGQSLAEQKRAAGKLSFIETISVFKDNPALWGWKDTIVFFNHGKRFQYQSPESLVDTRSGVICIPNNFEYGEGQNLPEGMLRITMLANYDGWKLLGEEEYRQQKTIWFEQARKSALQFLPQPKDESWKEKELAQDMFTPRTVEHFTRHFNGAIYGSPEKWKTGSTPWKNLYLCGTDQGFLGIIGAMLSGISMANAHILKAEI